MLTDFDACVLVSLVEALILNEEKALGTRLALARSGWYILETWDLGSPNQENASQVKVR